MNISLNNVSANMDFANSQEHRNMEVIPIVSTNQNRHEFITLGSGIDEGIVKISECEISTVNTVMAQNMASIPLVLIDGDEITGAMQNRIMNRSLIVPPKTSMPISVSCTEHGRWHTRGNSPKAREFAHSDYAADYNTRSLKSRALFAKDSCQSEVWNSISDFERKHNYRSNTSALNDSYVRLRPRQNEYLRNFRMVENQIGLLVCINNQIKGLELFYNSFIYGQYHEKILRTYIMEAISTYESPKFYNKDISKILSSLKDSKINNSPDEGMGKHFNFSNSCGTGSALVYEGDFVHLNFFISQEEANVKRFKSMNDFLDDFD
ncbi:MAG: hypothetical protein IKV87_00195 [Methanobrevibacter sp.]|nr:hypothetical protein [Methanobrevibacter sp.]